MKRAVDHSTGGARIGAALKAAGIVGIFRYAAAGRGDVNITPGEVADLRAHGIQIAIVVEHGAAALLGGYSVGKRHALEGRDIARACGLPDGVVYLAGDSEQLQDSGQNLALVGDAVRGAGDAIGHGNVGYYGSFYVIDYLVHRYTWVQFYWQTAAWSRGLRHSRACAYQEPRQALYGGVQCDFDELLADNWGQRGYRPPPPPPPKGSQVIVIDKNADGRLIIVAENPQTLEVHHIEQGQPGGDWWRTDDGKPNWLSLGTPGK